MSQRRLPAEIYWRRRLLALAGLILVVWIVLRLVGGGDDEPTAAPKPSATPTASATVAPTSATDGVVDVTLVSSTTACDPEQVRVTPSVRPGQRADGPVDVGLVVSSTARKACTLEPKDAELLAVIDANGTPIWDSTVCKEALLDTPVALSPQWATFVTVEWSGRGSGSRCSAKEGYATPGTYTVQIGTLGGEPGKTTFALEARPTPKPTPKPTKGETSSATPKPPKGTTKPAD